MRESDEGEREKTTTTTAWNWRTLDFPVDHTVGRVSASWETCLVSFLTTSATASSTFYAYGCTVLPF